MLPGYYTRGGHHFWEDVFFYRKWRIQRNHITKKCRLLDNWDICRKEGSFEDCRKAFVKFIEAFEIPKQKGHMIIMLCGFGQTKNVFKELWRAALKKGFLAAAVNYPTMQKNIDAHVRQLEFILNHMEDIDEISFVTNGTGSIILKKLFTIDSEWQHKLKIGRIVEINPRNHGNNMIKKMSSWPIIGFILGPMAKEMNRENIERIPSFPSNIQTGLVFCESVWQKFLAFITNTKLYKINPEYEKNFEKASETISFAPYFRNLFKNRRLTCSVIKFLQTGKF